jgi:rhamnogalacturonan endolyase
MLVANLPVSMLSEKSSVALKVRMKKKQYGYSPNDCSVGDLDGVRPAAVMCRGYYARTTLVSYQVQDKKLIQNWIYDSALSTGISAAGQGNHNLSVADVDRDGKDEIIYGSCAFDDDGTLLYSTGLGHGDAMHVSDLDPDRPGLEVWQVHEESASFSKGYEMHDAATGEIIWSGAVTTDNGRGMATEPQHYFRQVVFLPATALKRRPV